VESQIYP